MVAYASRVLTKPERRYCVTRRELLAVVTFVPHFRPYLLGRQFTIRTDHGSLTWLSNIKEPEGQLARWIEQLQEHLGEEKPLHKVKERFYWPGMHRDIKNWCQTCESLCDPKIFYKKESRFSRNHVSFLATVMASWSGMA